METFIDKVAREIFLTKQTNLEQLIIIMPSKRAGTFFKRALAKHYQKPVWLPKIYSIEEWLEVLSGYTIVDRTQLLFELYLSYQDVFPKAEQDSFEAFLKWAPTLLTDYNDVDAYLDNPEYLFNYVNEAKKVETWSPTGGEPSDLVENYLRFWGRIGDLFIDFKSRLAAQNIAFQGMAYRRASDTIEQWILENNPNKNSIHYLGFNAMNPSEEYIMRKLMQENLAVVYWDADSYYVRDEKQEAGNYLRKHKKWPEFDQKPFNWIESHLQNEKEIKVVGVPKSIAQAQLAGSIINKHIKSNKEPEGLALVLADESLLLPCLEFLPESLNKVNITMGNSLKNLHIYSFFDAYFQLHLNREKFSGSKAKFYYKDLFKIWQQPVIQNAINAIAIDGLKSKLQEQNHSFPTQELILSHCDESFKPWMEALLDYNASDPMSFIERALILIDLIKNNLIDQGRAGSLDLEQLFAFSKLFHQIKNLHDKYGFITELKTLYHLFQQCSKLESLSFVGEPLSGLQLMGMLETRTLDFEHIILLSANEGFLPEGKSDNSFIPFDIRKELGLATYLDKDSIFAYHFYRLLQRCKSMTIIYNTENDALGAGEKSRFISQLENEFALKFPNQVKYSEVILSHNLQPIVKKELSIPKDKDVMQRLKEIAQGKGFSPSSLNSYKSCPLQFYYEKILKIKDPEELEETIEANTLGTVVHRGLEELYTKHLNQPITASDIKKMMHMIPSTLKLGFAEEFKKGVFDKGKNLLVYTIAEQFLTSFLNEETKSLAKGTDIVIKGLEEDLKGRVTIDGIDFDIKLNGNADRIDTMNGTLRIIDYKTGLVQKSELLANDFKNFVRDKKFYKGFQLYLYAYLYQQMNPELTTINAGIISFRALKKGFLAAGFTNENQNTEQLNSALLINFETELKNLLQELFDESLDFHHRNRTEPCRFCDPEAFR